MSDVSSTVGGREISVTIKESKEFSASWYVFRGLPNEVRNDVIAFFGFEPDDVEGLTVHEVAVKGREKAHAVGAVADMGGKVLSRGKGGAAKQESSPAPEQPSEPQPAADPTAEILTAIEATASVDELKRLWAENQAAFSDAGVMAAWKARGKALKAAA